MMTEVKNLTEKLELICRQIASSASSEIVSSAQEFITATGTAIDLIQKEHK